MAGDSVYRARFDAAVQLHRKAIQGDRQAVQNALAQFAELRKADPSDALAEAYYGSSLALKGRDAAQLADKAQFAQQGLASLDRAISMSPDNVAVKLIRANVCMRLPEHVFGRTQTAIDDFNDLLARHQSNPDLLAPAQYRQVIQDLAKAYENAGRPGEASAIKQRYAQPQAGSTSRGEGAGKDGKKPKVRKSK